jgi:hypothetical protein
MLPRITAPVRSLVHVWPCSAPLQPLLPLPFPASSLLVIFCAQLTFHHSLFCPISHFPPRFPYASLIALCPSLHICCLDTGFECLPLLPLPFSRYCGNRLVPYCEEPTQKHSNLTYFFLFIACLVHDLKNQQKHVRTRESTQCPVVFVQLYSLSCIRLTLANCW